MDRARSQHHKATERDKDAADVPKLHICNGNHGGVGMKLNDKAALVRDKDCLNPVGRFLAWEGHLAFEAGKNSTKKIPRVQGLRPGS